MFFRDHVQKLNLVIILFFNALINKKEHTPIISTEIILVAICIGSIDKWIQKIVRQSRSAKKPFCAGQDRSIKWLVFRAVVRLRGRVQRRLPVWSVA